MHLNVNCQNYIVYYFFLRYERQNVWYFPLETLYRSQIGTICLPTPATRDKGVEVTSAGWGVKRVEGSCVTNQFGPRIFKPCATEFCERIEPAPSGPRCKDIKSKVAFREGVDVITVRDVEARAAKRNGVGGVGVGGATTCYKSHGKFGWCRTKRASSTKISTSCRN